MRAPTRSSASPSPETRSSASAATRRSPAWRRQDAWSLETAWHAHGTWRETLAAYDADRTAAGAALVRLGRRLGRAQVEETPHWPDMREPDLEAWWQEQHHGSDRTSGFGGHHPPLGR